MTVRTCLLANIFEINLIDAGAILHVVRHPRRRDDAVSYTHLEVSDRLCKENGLSVIPPSQNKGMGYKAVSYTHLWVYIKKLQASFDYSKIK